MANNLFHYTDDNTCIFSDLYTGKISSNKANYVGLLDFIKNRNKIHDIFDNHQLGGSVGPWMIMRVMHITNDNLYLTTNLETGERNFLMIASTDCTDYAGYTYHHYSRQLAIFKKYCADDILLKFY